MMSPKSMPQLFNTVIWLTSGLLGGFVMTHSWQLVQVFFKVDCTSLLSLFVITGNSAVFALGSWTSEVDEWFSQMYIRVLMYGHHCAFAICNTSLDAKCILNEVLSDFLRVVIMSIGYMYIAVVISYICTSKTSLKGGFTTLARRD